MQIKSRVVVSISVLWVVPAACLASASSYKGVGTTQQFANTGPRSAHEQAVAYYNQGVRQVGKAKEEEEDAAKPGADDKKVAKGLEKAQKTYASALQDFQKAVDKDGAMVEAWNYVGFCQRHLGNYKDSLAAYAKALDLNPTYAEAYEYRAEAYLGLNMLDEAKDSYMQLFRNVRPLADELMTSMHHWVDEHHKDSKGVNEDALDAFAKWVDERARIAQQTASLWQGPANTKQVDWN
jgi:tetratricopeptide (TPR) repeat protein